jgi:hypothetical protein
MAIYLANLGDQLDDYRPVCFSPEEFGSYFITLVPKGTVVKYGLPTSTSNPVLLPPGGQPGDEHLNWTPILEPAVNIPCFGAFLMACPVLPGNPAFDMLPIGSDLEPGTVTKAPMFARWFSSLQYLCQHNHGVSLHADNTYFTWSEVEAAKFAELPLRNAPAILLEGIGTLDDHHINVAAIFKAERLAAYFRFSQNSVVRQAPATPQPPPAQAASVRRTSKN